ncbi:hypothetical protein DFQ26_008098 [Actinomortierella ambigua]|nr:hypothetical protein DFQ26_008098 [Actinomortierella ambigua]
MLYTKFAAALAFVAAASAATEEGLCFKNGQAIMYTTDKYIGCYTTPQTSVLDNWGGGRSSTCNNGSWELYWKVTGSDYARVCYGQLATCNKYVAHKNDWMAGKVGAQKCWTATIP